MSQQRDYAVLWLNASKTVPGGTAGGGNILLATPKHKLDGPEHLPAEFGTDRSDLDATTTQHGLMVPLSGNVGESFRGDGTWVANTGSAPTDAAGWAPVMASAPNIVTTDGAVVYLVLTDGSGNPVMGYGPW